MTVPEVVFAPYQRSFFCAFFRTKSRFSGSHFLTFLSGFRTKSRFYTVPEVVLSVPEVVFGPYQKSFLRRFPPYQTSFYAAVCQPRFRPGSVPEVVFAFVEKLRFFCHNVRFAGKKRGFRTGINDFLYGPGSSALFPDRRRRFFFIFFAPSPPSGTAKLPRQKFSTVRKVAA